MTFQPLVAGAIATSLLGLLSIPLAACNPQATATVPANPTATPSSAPPLTPSPATPSPATPSPATPSPPALKSLSQPPNLGLDTQIWGEQESERGGDRAALLTAIDHSLRYLDTPKAAEDYKTYPIPGVTQDRVRRSLRRFRQLVRYSGSAQALRKAVQREFEFYQASGNDGQGTVHFTGYFEPTYAASASPTAEYRYPLFKRPTDLDQWPKPHPDRLALEGKDGLQASQGKLKGLELVWLKSRLEAFLVQVQGSAKLALTDGSTMTVGYAGRTDYPYVSVGRELVNDGKFTLEDLSLPVMLNYFRQNPQSLDEYLPRNSRFVFFKETGGAPATGSLAVPVTAGRSIATDKSLMPPGALALLETPLPTPLPHTEGPGRYRKQTVSRFVLDQDTGGAIQGAGRVDLFVGTGVEAGDRAGLINDTGQLYYLLLKDGF